MIKNTAALFGFQLGREKLLLRGNPVKIAGKIGMQLTVLDLEKTPCTPGDTIEVPLRRTLANARIPRFYKKNGEFFRKRIIEEGFLSLYTEYSNTPV
jgi:alanine racemase